MAEPPAGRAPARKRTGPAGALKYEPRHCAEVVAFMGRGYSLTAFAGEIGTTRANLMKWCDEHGPFADAVARAQARRARLLEDKMLEAKGAGAFGVHMQALKTAAPDEWAEDKARNPRPDALSPRAAAGVDLPYNGRD